MSGDGMTSFITALTAEQGGITSANVWSELSHIAPLVATLTLIALGIYFVRRVVKKASKGKGGM